MKPSSRSPDLLAVVLAVVAVALGASLVIEPMYLGDRWLVRCVLLAGGIATAGAATYRLIAGRERVRKGLLRFVKLLARLDTHDLANETPDAACAAIGAGGAWRDVFRQIHQCLLTYSRHIEDAQHVRDRSEVRVRQLAGEKEQIAQILAGLSDPVLAIGPYDELLVVNDSARKLLQVDADLESPEQRTLDQLVKCENLVQLLTESRRRKTPTRRCDELSLIDEDGQTHWYRVTCRGITTEAGTENGASQGAVAVLSDIDGLKDLQKRNAEFVSAVSHEMKTPLAGIKAYVELLADGDAEDEATRDEFLSVIDSQADRLQRLVENLLNLARIEAGVVQVSKEPRSLNELLEEAFGVVQPSAEKKRINLVNDLSPMYLGVLADRDMMMQAAINLLSNAVKYTPSGGDVTLRSRMVDETVVFEVEDTGVGLDEEDAQKVFEKFYRVKKDSQMAAGTGLGLPLAKHIVEDVHGGQLTVESQLGKGSVFRITLPGVQEIATASALH